MLKKNILILLCSFILCGCTSVSNKEVITFSSWGSITEVNILKEIISDFENKNPDIKINFIHTPQNYFQKLHLLFASNTPPDVLFINNLYLPTYADFLLDLSNHTSKKDFYEQSINALSYDNRLLAIPRDVSNLVLYVNKELVKNIPNTWDIETMLKIAEEATKNGNFGISFEEETYYLLPYLSYFGEIFEENYQPETSKGFRFYKDLRDKYKVAPRRSQIGSSTLAQMFLDKKIALYLSGRWMFPKIKEKADFEWEIISFPQGEKPQPCDASGWAISKNSKHQDSAIKFVQYLSNEQNSELFAKTGLIIPARKNTAQKLDNKEHNEAEFLRVIVASDNTMVFKNYKKMVDKTNILIQQ